MRAAAVGNSDAHVEDLGGRHNPSKTHHQVRKRQADNNFSFRHAPFKQRRNHELSHSPLLAPIRFYQAHHVCDGIFHLLHQHALHFPARVVFLNNINLDQATFGNVLGTI